MFGFSNQEQGQVYVPVRAEDSVNAMTMSLNATGSGEQGAVGGGFTIYWYDSGLKDTGSWVFDPKSGAAIIYSPGNSDSTNQQITQAALTALNNGNYAAIERLRSRGCLVWG